MDERYSGRLRNSTTRPEITFHAPTACVQVGRIENGSVRPTRTPNSEKEVRSASLIKKRLRCKIREKRCCRSEKAQVAPRHAACSPHITAIMVRSILGWILDCRQGLSISVSFSMFLPSPPERANGVLKVAMAIIFVPPRFFCLEPTVEH